MNKYKIPKGLQKDLTIICYAIVSSLFATSCNPKSIGPNFTWEKFPKYAQDYCQKHLCLNIDIPKIHEDNAYEFVKDTSLEIAQYLIRMMKE